MPHPRKLGLHPFRSEYGNTGKPRPRPNQPCGRVGNWRMVLMWLKDNRGGSRLLSASGSLHLPGGGIGLHMQPDRNEQSWWRAG